MRRFAITTVPFPPSWIGSIFGAGLLLSLGLFVLVRHWERNALETEAAELVREQLDKLEVTILRSTEVLHSIGALYQARGRMEREEFHRFVKRALERQPELQAISWNPRIAAADRAEFERLAIGEGLADFSIRERETSGKLVRAQDRAEYVPVQLIEPAEGNASALGYDLSSDPIRQQSLELARGRWQIVATAPICLAQKASQESGLLVLLPVSALLGAGDVANPGERLAGFAVAVFRVTNLVGDKPSAQPIEQAHAQVRFERFEPMTQGRGRQM